MATLQAQFGRIRRQANSKLTNQKQYATTLLAIEETLREQDGQLTPPSYFATLLTLLEQQQGLNDGLHEPVLYLLAIVLPHTPTMILRSKFTTMLGILSSSIDLSQADAPVIRSVIKVLEVLLTALDANGWGQIIAQKAMQSILILATDPRPKVRKVAQEAATEILSRPPPVITQHPAAEAVATHCLDWLSDTKQHNPQALIHVLQLTKAVVPYWPINMLEKLCEPLLQLPKANNTYVTTSVFDTFGEIFERAGERLGNNQLRSILEIIVEMKPNINDAALSSSWHRIIARGYAAYAKQDPELCFAALPDIFDTLFSDLELGKPAAQQTAATTLRALLVKCVPKSHKTQDPAVMSRLVKSLAGGLGYRFKPVWAVVLLLIAVAFNSLGKQARPALDPLLELVSSLRMEPDFELKAEADATLGAAVSAIGPEVFLSVLPLNIDAVTGKDKNAVGRAWLLPLMKDYIEHAPLGYFTDTLLPTADLLSKHRDEFKAKRRTVESRVFGALNQQVWALFSGFCDAPLDVTVKFSSDFAARLGSEIHESPELRSYICTGIQRLVRSIHRLATAVTDDESTRNSEEVMTQEQAQGALHHLSQFTTNFLLVLFNVFSQTASPSRGYLFDTIQELLLITPQDDVSNAFERVHGMLVAALSEHVPQTPAQQTRQYIESNPPSAAHTMLDLAIAMVLSINRKLTDEFLKTIIPLIGQNEDPTLQKKAYKALYKLCGAGTTDTSRDSIHAALLPTLLPALIDATDVTAAGSRRERLALLALLVKHSLPASELHVIPTLLSEAIISTKEVNEKARTAAFDMLLALGHKMCKGGIVDTSKMTDAGADAEGEAKSASLEEYFKMVFAGLAAKTPHMVSATISALARLMFEFHSQLRPEFIAEILDTTLLFVDTNSREIAKSALGFVKVAVVALPPPILEQSLPKAVPCILKWSNEHKNRLKLNARHIIERLIRKFGLDAVDRVTPEEHKKLIGNIRKRKLRAANNKAAKGSKANGGEGEEKEAVEMAGLPAGKKNKYGNAYEDALYGSESDLDSSDSDEDYSSGEEGGKRGKTGKRGNKKSGKQAQEDPWIHESGDGPLDFLDRKAFVHMSTTKPKSKKERSLTKEFKVKDGRLVIEDEAESGDEKDKAQEPDRTKKQAVGRGEAEDYYRQMVESKEGFTRGQGNKIKFAKRKPGHDNDDDGDDAMEIENDSGRPSPKKAKKQKDRAGALGKEYRSKNAAGDMQKKGKVEPFAYIPLNPKLLGKRNSQNLGVKGNSKRGKRKAHHA